MCLASPVGLWFEVLQGSSSPQQQCLTAAAAAAALHRHDTQACATCLLLGTAQRLSCGSIMGRGVCHTLCVSFADIWQALLVGALVCVSAATTTDTFTFVTQTHCTPCCPIACTHASAIQASEGGGLHHPGVQPRMVVVHTGGAVSSTTAHIHATLYSSWFLIPPPLSTDVAASPAAGFFGAGCVFEMLEAVLQLCVCVCMFMVAQASGCGTGLSCDDLTHPVVCFCGSLMR